MQAGDEKKVNCSESSHWLCLLQGYSKVETVPQGQQGCSASTWQDAFLLKESWETKAGLGRCRACRAG